MRTQKDGEDTRGHRVQKFAFCKLTKHPFAFYEGKLICIKSSLVKAVSPHFTVQI